MNTDLWTPLPDDLRALILKRMLHGLTGLDAWRVPRWIYGVACASKTSGALFRDPNHTIWKELCGLLGLTQPLLRYTWKETFRGIVLDTILMDGLLQHSCVFPLGIVAPCIEGVDLARVKTTLPLSIPVGNYSVKMFARRLSVLHHVVRLMARRGLRRADFDGKFVASFDADPCFRHADQDPMPRLYWLFGVGDVGNRMPRMTLSFGRGLALTFVPQALLFFDNAYGVKDFSFAEQIGYDRRLQRAASAPLDTGPPNVAPATGADAVAMLAAVQDAIREGGAPQSWAEGGQRFLFPFLLTGEWDAIDDAFPGHLEALFTMLTVAGLDDRVKERFPCHIRDLLSKLLSWRSEFVDTLPTLDAYAS
jgi:hypothetical protein